MKPEADGADPWTVWIADEIQKARRDQRFSQAMLARAAGIDSSHMGKLERHEHDVRFCTLMNVLEILDLEPRRLFQRIAARRGPPYDRPTKPRGSRPLRRETGGEVNGPAKEGYQRTLGRALRYEREQQRDSRTRDLLSRGELAERAHCSVSALSDIENGESNPQMLTLMAILDALDVEPAAFFGRIRLAKR